MRTITTTKVPTYWFREVPVRFPGVQVQSWGGVVLDHPGEHRILGQVVKGPVSQAVHRAELLREVFHGQKNTQC